MKILFKNLFLFLISVSFILTSCSKPEDLPRPDNENPIVDDVDIVPLITNIEWVLRGGNLYFVDSNSYYTHDVTLSVLDPFHGGLNFIDTIQMNLTTWKFIGDDNGYFYLNGDNYGSYEINTAGNIRIWTNTIPSVTRIIENPQVNNGRLEFKTSNIGTVIGRPFSKLVFSDGSTPINNNPTNPSNAINNSGTININVSVNELSGTVWVITKYQPSGGVVISYSDTIQFYDQYYSYNNIITINRSYRLNDVIGFPLKDLTMNSLPTPGGGNYNIRVGVDFILDGLINNTDVNDPFTNGTYGKITMIKL